jgi:integrase
VFITGEEIPYIYVREHPELKRTIKTGEAGERKLPLLGAGLIAVQEALDQHPEGSGDGWLFPSLIRSKNYAGNKVNEWLLETIGSEDGERKNSHSFRHSTETRLVLAKVDQRLVDAIIGHKPQAKMGSVYFSGYRLEDFVEALNLIAIHPASDAVRDMP